MFILSFLVTFASASWPAAWVGVWWFSRVVDWLSVPFGPGSVYRRGLHPHRSVSRSASHLHMTLVSLLVSLSLSLLHNIFVRS
eukprot:COSAG05_NODE_1482_length_4755_cov_52.621564_3_plen_83_part_00